MRADEIVARVRLAAGIDGAWLLRGRAGTTNGRQGGVVPHVGQGAGGLMEFMLCHTSKMSCSRSIINKFGRSQLQTNS